MRLYLIVSASVKGGSHSHSYLSGLAKPIAYIWENTFDSLCHRLPNCNSSVVIAIRSSPKEVITKHWEGSGLVLRLVSLAVRALFSGLDHWTGILNWTAELTFWPQKYSV